MFVRKFRFLVLPPDGTFPLRSDDAHQVDVELRLLDGSEVVWVDGVIVYNAVSMKLSNEIPVTIGSKSGVVKVTAGWHLSGRVRLFVDGRLVDPAPKGTGLPEVPRTEAPPARSVLRSPVLWGGMAAGLASGLTPVVMKAGAVAKLFVFGVAAAALVGMVSWERARRRRK